MNLKLKRIEFRLHAIRRMFERRISDEEVLKVIQEGEVTIVVTAYQPDPSLWEDNFRSRREL